MKFSSLAIAISTVAALKVTRELQHAKYFGVHSGTRGARSCVLAVSSAQFLVLFLAPSRTDVKVASRY